MIKKKSLLAGITALAVVLSSGIAAFAATDTPELQVEKTRPAMMVNLTDAQREAVHQARTDIMKEVQRDRDGVCNLTDEQRTALHDAMREKLESKLAVLVDDGTLTQELADQFLEDRGGPMGPGWKHRNRVE